jgi:predicted nucleic acid-binding protein
MAQSTVILDACVLINLLASGEAESIIRVAAEEFRICEVVEKETIYLRSDDPQEETFEAVQIAPLKDAGLLSVCAVENPIEEVLYVNYASQVDDGEAMSIAIAETRGYKIATDDRKARRIFLEATGAPDRLIWTSDLVRKWAEQENISPEKLKSTLLSIRQRATFFPPKRDANHNWWMSNLS